MKIKKSARGHTAAVAANKAHARRPRHGGRRKRFDTVFERFWHLAQFKAALIKWGRSQETPLDYSSVMRLAVQEFVASRRISLPAPDAALTLLAGEQNARPD